MSIRLFDDISVLQRLPVVERTGNKVYPFAVQAIREGARYNPNFLRPFIASLPKEIRNNPEFILALIQTAGEPIRQYLLKQVPEPNNGGATDRFLQDPMFIRGLVSDLSVELMDDPVFILRLMKKTTDGLNIDGRMMVFYSLLKNCSVALQNNPKFLSSMIRIAAKDCNDAMVSLFFMLDAPDELRNNRVYSVAVAGFTPMALLTVSDEDLEDPNYMKMLVLTAPESLRYAPMEYREDPNFLLSVPEGASDEQLGNPDLFLALVRYAAGPLMRNSAYVSWLLDLAPERILQDPHFIHAILEMVPGGPGDYGRNALRERLLTKLASSNISGG